MYAKSAPSVALGPPIMDEWINKFIGIAGGSFLSLVFAPPRSLDGFVRRIGASVVFGYIFGHLFLALLMQWMNTEERTAEHVTAAWAIASFSSWIAMGAYSRYVRDKHQE